MGSLLLERGEWQLLVYPNAGSRLAFREHDDYVVLWDQPAGKVKAKVRMTGSVIDGIDFQAGA